MPNNRTIPKGYMTVGELAKKMGTTVRTLQYYDREGLFSLSAESEGGRRLYTDKDMVQLHQILSMKSLGFSLDDIKNRLIPLETPADVAEALAEQAAAVQKQIETLSSSLENIEALRAEVLQMESVDFKKYADIIINLQMKNEYYWLVKHFDDQTLDHFHRRFDKDSSRRMMETFNHLQDRAVEFQKDGVSPEREEGLAFAKEFWDMITEFTGGDMTMMTKLMESAGFESPNSEWAQRQSTAQAFIGPALEAYFTKLRVDPFEEGPK